MTATVPSTSGPKARTATAGSVAATRIGAALPPERVAELTAHATAGGDTPVETHAPATDVRIGELPQSSTADVDSAFVRAREAQRAWAARPLAERVAVLARLHDLVLRRQREILDIVQTETGKARAHAFEEVADVAINARYYARTAAEHLKTHRRGGVLPVLTSARELRHPKGVVAIISPWNYPLALSVSDALPALVAGNAVVSRPDNQTALTTLWAHELAVEAGLPAEVWQIVLGRGRQIGAALIERADFVDYTGSTATGRTVAAQAAERLIGVSLELGGKNPMLVLADADVDKAAAGAVRACFASSGQLCESMERIYVHESIADAFLEAFATRVRAMRLGGALDFDADMGSLTFPRQLERVAAHVDDAVAKGATVAAGGRARPDLGPYFYEPTVLTDVTADMDVHGEETFGPVVSVYRVDSDDDAVAEANDTAYGLNACIYTRNAGHGRRLAERLHSGAVNINEGYTAAWASVQAPSGGIGDSGLGRRHGAEGILKYTNSQTIATQRLLPIAPLPGMSEQMWARTMSVALWGFRPARDEIGMTMKSVKGKKVLITGAAQGLGKLFAVRAVEEGASDVVLWDINEGGLKDTAAELEAAGGTVHTYVVDVSKPKPVAAAAALVRKEVGDIHVLINNAGIVRGNGYFWDNAVSDVEATMTINAVAPMLITREFLPAMVAGTTECRVVNIASSAGLTPVPRLAAYCGSKWAATGWSDSVRVELEQAGHKHVKVTTVCPTYINTGMFDGAKGILFTPMLEQDDVVNDVWRELLKGGPFLITPWTSKLSKVVSAVLPTRLRDEWLQRTGVYDSMSQFTGHQK